MEDWIHLDNLSGIGNETINIKIDDNYDINDRNAIINITNGETIKQININQKGNNMRHVIFDFSSNNTFVSAYCVETNETFTNENINDLYNLVDNNFPNKISISLLKTTTYTKYQMSYIQRGSGAINCFVEHNNKMIGFVFKEDGTITYMEQELN